MKTSLGKCKVVLKESPDAVVIDRVIAEQRGAGREAMAALCEAADRHGVILKLLASPVDGFNGLVLEGRQLLKFYTGFGFYSFSEDRGMPDMAREPR